MLLLAIFVAGVLHGLGPDHLAGITAFGTSGGRDARRVVFFSTRFAAGHAVVIAAFGLAGCVVCRNPKNFMQKETPLPIPCWRQRQWAMIPTYVYSGGRSCTTSARQSLQDSYTAAGAPSAMQRPGQNWSME